MIEVSLTPALYSYRTLTANHVTVAIDLLRATTAICAAFQAGCSEVVPLDSLEALEPYRHQGYAIAAERGGKKLPGSDYGNSPTEYMSLDMRGVRLAYSTTNGTVSILRGADAEMTLCGSFSNLDALCHRLEEVGLDVVLLCSGWQNDFCIEDTLVAGAIIEKLTTHHPLPTTHYQLPTTNSIHGDAAHMALALWQQAKDDPRAFCERASHVYRLMTFGADADIDFAFLQDTCPVVPTLKQGKLIKLDN